MRPLAGPGLALALLVAPGCTGVPTSPRAEIQAGVDDLAAGGFEFQPDVHFGLDRYLSCDGITCADLLVIKERRTIMLAPDGLRSPSTVRASLLEIWERYREPRPGSLPDLARGAQRVLTDGPRVGVEDRHVLRKAHHTYRRLWTKLTPEQREGLQDPDSIPFP